MNRPNRPAPLLHRHSWVVGALAAVLVALASPPASGQDPLLWGGLEPGPYAVAYRSLYRLDHTRQYDPEFVTDAAKPPVHKPRPILIRVWYPARKTDARPMKYRQYLDVSSSDPVLAPIVKRLSRHVVNVVSEETVGKEPGERTPAETAAFERLLATRTFAVKDAPPAEGRFPVVLHHPGLGGVPGDSSVLCELLASRGYVVLSSAYQNWYAEGVGISSDLHTWFRDLARAGPASASSSPLGHPGSTPTRSPGRARPCEECQCGRPDTGAVRGGFRRPLAHPGPELRLLRSQADRLGRRVLDLSAQGPPGQDEG